MKKLYLLIIFLAFAAFAQAQNISVKDFYYAENDLTARTYGTSEEDQNGNLCALIKVRTTERGMWTFDVGMLGVKKTEMQNEKHSAEIWVYVPYGVTRMTIQHEKLGILDRWPFPCSIEKGCTYIMELTTGKVTVYVEEEVHEGFLIFQLDPPDAMLEVNDQMWPVTASGTARKLMDFGTYTYRVQALNYHPEVGKVTVDSDETKKVPVTLKPNFGWVEVTSNDALQGAAVYVDNALIGKVPCKSEALKSGQHSVRIVKEMFEPYATTVIVSDNETAKISPNLTADFARVTLKVDADAEIWVNDERKGTRTWTGDLGSGTYKMECRQANYETTMVKKEITNQMEGEVITLEAPQPIYGSLVVESDPDEATIYIDGKAMGETPKLIKEILIGSHEIRLTKEGYAEHTQTVTIAKGERKQVTATMYALSGTFLSGTFSVTPEKQVHFSQGNLQYQPSTNKWRFAEHQWDYVGTQTPDPGGRFGGTVEGSDNAIISDSYNGWMDFFGWCANENPAKYCICEFYSDWGSKFGSDWRTLTKDEWEYVFDRRSTSSGIRFVMGTVNGVHGVILLPDNWNKTYYLLNNTNPEKWHIDSSYEDNIISATEWYDIFEANGGVFMPAAGLGVVDHIVDVNDSGRYWTSTPGDNYRVAWQVVFSCFAVEVRGDYVTDGGGGDGCSVRLVRNIGK